MCLIVYSQLELIYYIYSILYLYRYYSYTPPVRGFSCNLSTVLLSIYFIGRVILAKATAESLVMIILNSTGFVVVRRGW